jgi:dihydrofolate reductase
MAKIILNLAASIDGFIADEQGEVDWLNDFMKPEEDYGMNAFFKTVGTAVMGSKTYEQTLSFNYWYPNMDGVVFTSRKLPLLENVSLQFVNDRPEVVIDKLRKKEKDCWLVGGAALISSFLNQNLIDEFILTLVPRLLGKGIPLCPELNSIYKLQLLEHKAFKDGVVQLKFNFLS